MLTHLQRPEPSDGVAHEKARRPSLMTSSMTEQTLPLKNDMMLPTCFQGNLLVPLRELIHQNGKSAILGNTITAKNVDVKQGDA